MVLIPTFIPFNIIAEHLANDNAGSALTVFRSIVSNWSASQIPEFSFIIHSDHSWFFGVFLLHSARVSLTPIVENSKSKDLTPGTFYKNFENKNPSMW